MKWLIEKYIGWAFHNPDKVLLLAILSNLVFWGLIAYGVIHFIAKYW